MNFNHEIIKACNGDGDREELLVHQGVFESFSLNITFALSDWLIHLPGLLVRAPRVSAGPLRCSPAGTREVSGQKPGVVRESQRKEAIAAEKTFIYTVTYTCQRRERARKFQLVVIIIE